MLKGFKKFILRGNVVDLAVGVVVGAAFGTVVTSLVADLLTPLIGSLAKVPDFSGWFFTLNGSNLMVGNFINNLISFLIVVTAIYFLVVTPLNSLIAKTKKEEVVESTTKKCPHCCSEIAIDAKRCPHCTSELS